ncbi:uncharacterized protein [Palaemon carinicauda]|uniref:uncharacterized protein n=1 Tax=Palaemon carinicauda TaxID=392227 RepID=UPI0035B603D4
MTPMPSSSVTLVLVDLDRGYLFKCANRSNILEITLLQTTTYNPVDLGQVDRLHCTLKAALMSRYKDSNWFTQPPWFCLGLRTIPKDPLDVSAAEVMYGDLLVILDELFPSATSSDNPQRLVTLWENLLHVARLAHPLLSNIYRQICISATHIFLRNDTRKSLLTPPYMGPFLVIRLTLKAFLINVRGQEDWVSLDHLKKQENSNMDPRANSKGRVLKSIQVGR